MGDGASARFVVARDVAVDAVEIGFFELLLERGVSMGVNGLIPDLFWFFVAVRAGVYADITCFAFACRRGLLVFEGLLVRVVHLLVIRIHLRLDGLVGA